jgi:cytochrome c551/c552
MRNIVSRAAVIGLAVGLSGPALAADPQSIDWSKISTQSITLFYPGLSTYDWLLSPAHSGATLVSQGQACLTCHKGTEKTRGEKIVKGGDLEPTPIPDKNGAIDVMAQAAHDADYVYFRFQWKTNLNREGRMHDYVRFDGKQWKWYGHDRNDKAVRAGEQPALYEDRFSIMLDDGKVPLFAQQGCWVTCHNGMRDTRNQVVGDPVKKHPLFADAKYDPKLGQDQIERGDRSDQGRRRLPRPYAMARKPLRSGRDGRRRLRARVPKLRRGQESILLEHRSQNDDAAQHVRRR